MSEGLQHRATPCADKHRPFRTRQPKLKSSHRAVENKLLHVTAVCQRRAQLVVKTHVESSLGLEGVRLLATFVAAFRIVSALKGLGLSAMGAAHREGASTMARQP
jgi:hypothetical protein